MDGFVYEYHSEGFFGYSETPVFEYFSFAHFLPIVLLIIGIFLHKRNTPYTLYHIFFNLYSIKFKKIIIFLSFSSIFLQKND